MIIFIPRTLEAELQPPAMRFAGYFIVELIHARTGFVKRRLEFPNLILDSGLNALGNAVGGIPSVTGIIGYMCVGTGNAIPVVTDTTLGAEVGRTSNDGGVADVKAAGPSSTYWYLRRTRLFTEAQANGNLTEVGMSSNVATNGTPLWTRQLFKDGTGTPTVITKTSDDQLRVTYEMRLLTPTADVSGVVTMSGTDYTWTTRAYEKDEANNWGRALTDFPGSVISWNQRQEALESDTLIADTATQLGTRVPATTITASAYVNGNFYRDVENLWNPGVANFATGIGQVLTSVAQWAANGWTLVWQTNFAPKILKTDLKRLRLTFRHKFQRV